VRKIFGPTRRTRKGAALQGTGGKRIKRALRLLGCTPSEYEFTSTRKARRKVDELLAQNIPIILFVEEGLHWAVFAARERGKYVWIDPAENELVGAWSWSDIVDWIEDDEIYFIGVEGEKSPANSRRSQKKNYSGRLNKRRTDNLLKGLCFFTYLYLRRFKYGWRPSVGVGLF